jgi:acyl-CoA thioesterase
VTNDPAAHSNHTARGALFSEATAVQPSDDALRVDGAAGTASRWSGNIAEGWAIAGNANGGYVLSIAARAMTGALGRPDPVTVTAHYLAPGQPGPVSVVVEITKQGRKFGTATAKVADEKRLILQVLGTFGDLADVAGPELIDVEPPPMPPPDQCIPMPVSDPSRPPFMGNVDLQLHPEDAGFLRGEPSGNALMRGWFRLHNEEAVDAFALLCAADSFPPAIFNTTLPRGWTPTMELTVHVRSRPGSDWLRCRFATRFVTGGFLEETGELWDDNGRLVAQSRQLALVPRADSLPH